MTANPGEVGALIAAAFSWTAAAVSCAVSAFMVGRRKKPSMNAVEICQCGHGSAFHDGSGCKMLVEKGVVLKYNSYGEPKMWKAAPCACVRYVGPGTSYVPELDGPNGPLDR
jgi:hypothetical protein